jgi:PAS domain S-box-containing protein
MRSGNGPEHERLVIALKAARSGTWHWDIAPDKVEWDEALCAVYGLSPEASPRTAGEFFELVHPEDRERVAKALQDCLESGNELEYEFRALIGDRAIWIYDRSVLVRDTSGQPSYMTGACLDITSRKQMEQALRESEGRFSKAFNIATHPMAITTLKGGRFVDINPAGLAAGGLSRDQVIGQSEDSLHFYQDPAIYDLIRTRLEKDSSFTNVEATLRGKKEPRTFLLSGAVVDYLGEPCVFTSAIDITERKEAEERARLLMREIDHRSNNLLAIVQVIAHSTVSESTPETFFERFSQRLSALSASNRLLVSGDWQSTDVCSLVKSQLSHLDPQMDRRVSLSGAKIRLKPVAVQAVGMALHELATNAAKYGSLSTSRGAVSIDWKLVENAAGQQFRIDWKESEGPAVQPPKHIGFGHTVMVRMMESTLDARVDLQFPASGAIWTMSCPAAKVVAQ